MKMQHATSILSAVLIGLSVLVSPSSAEAQFLKKLTKSLEKVNKKLEQVEKAVSGQPLIKNNKTGEGKTASTASSQSSPVRQAEPNIPVKAPTENKTDDWEKRTPTPHLTWQTKYLQKKVEYDNLSNVSEGIFCLPEYNHSIGYAVYFGFWTVDGKRLFPSIYEQFGEKPRFDSGACVMKSSDEKNRCPVILYADGRIRQLSGEWNAVTQFYDGVAMVREVAGLRGINIFYIDNEGKKIWPHLAEMDVKGNAVVVMRPVRNGLRAFYSNAKKKWGFLDANGKIAIQPSFNEVRDFSGDYALVSLGDSYYERTAVFIDRTGKAVVTVPGKYPTLQRISDIANNCFSISEDRGAPTTFYNLKGEPLKTYAGGASGFCDGTAFMRIEQYNDKSPVFIIDRRFNIIGECPAQPRVNYFPDKPTFVASPWFTCHEKIAIDHSGQPAMFVPKSGFPGNKLGPFSSDGYAKARSVFIDEVTGRKFIYTGYVDTTGRYTVVFCNEEGGNGPFEHRLPGPTHLADNILQDPPHPPFLLPVDTASTGPTTTEKALYEVTVRAVPAEGGTVYGSGKYAYGDTIRVTGTPAVGYRLSDINCSRQASLTPTFNRFVVKGSMDIDCHFVKKDSIKPLDTGYFAGELTVPGLTQQAEVYLQVGDTTGSTYTNGSNGFLAVLFDANKKIVIDKDINNKAGATVSLNIFFAPMNVLGKTEEKDRTWLHVDGGVAVYANFSISDNMATGVINNPLLALTLAFDGMESGKTEAGRYRIDITDSDLDKGIVRLGIIQRFSPEYGWLPAGDKIFERKKSGFFNKRIEKGLPADFFDSVTLDACPRRTGIPFYPPEGFYEKDNSSELNALVKALGKMYRDTGSDYDMQQFSEDLDKILIGH